MPVENLGTPCGVCGRVSGDHTLREWAACLGEVTTDLPYEPVPEDAERVAARVRQQFGVDEDQVIADHVMVKAGTLTARAGTVDVMIPVLFHEFAIGLPGLAPVPVAKVAFIGDPAMMRKYGRLARDSANGAANAAERG